MQLLVSTVVIIKIQLNNKNNIELIQPKPDINCDRKKKLHIRIIIFNYYTALLSANNINNVVTIYTLFL